MEDKRYQLEHEISTIIQNDNGCTVHFDYDKGEKFTIAHNVSAMTVNPKTMEKFLLMRVCHDTIEQCLEQILEYVKSYKEKDSFTVSWSKVVDNRTEPEKHDSFFYCDDITQVIDRFYAGKNRKDYIIFNVKLNPRS